ncbi:MAG TPA: hypothetical protein PK514_15035 [Spirochaetota bacterium]|nr:hypothetical protein [Spirochaetota bacterium]
MKKEYDFSKGVRGKFYIDRDRIEIPVYLDKSIKEFFFKAASKKNISVDKLINTILKKEMDMIKSVSDID